MSGWSPWEVRTNVDFMRQEIDVVVVHETRDGTRSVVPPLQLEPIPAPGWALTPTFQAAPDDAKALMQAFLDAAWEMGLRPKDYEGPQEMKAVNRHLEDMRRLAFHAITSEKA